MKQLLLSIVFIQLSFICVCQKQVQQLPPVRISVFKNGNFFLKRSGEVQVIDRTFTLPAPTDALMGSFWLSAGKDVAVQSIALRLDTMRVEKAPVTMDDYLIASINKQISIPKSSYSTDQQSGVLLSFDKESQIARIRNSNGSISIIKVTDLDELHLASDAKSSIFRDSIIPLATVRLNKPESTVSATTLSLHPGIHWYASYLFTTLNDKEATLSMKATLVNKQEFNVNAMLDIIIGNPEMFYGKQLDPACALFLKGDLFSGDNNGFSLNFANTISQANTSSAWRHNVEDADEESEPGDNNGNKMEDLFVYNLGIQKLEAQSSLIIPIVNTTVTYEDIYTVDFPVAIIENVPVFHKYRMMNSTGAPLTTGSILVVNKQELPIAQSQLQYTPVKAAQDIELSKALDLQVKNEETNIKTEKTMSLLSAGRFYDKVTYKGTIDLQNFEDKKIKILVTKNVTGKVIDANQMAKKKYLRGENNAINKLTILEWEIELAPGAQQQLTYTYTSME